MNERFRIIIMQSEAEPAEESELSRRERVPEKRKLVNEALGKDIYNDDTMIRMQNMLMRGSRGLVASLSRI